MFDEWQDAAKIWGAIRKDCDDNPDNTGEYFLTGSTSQKIDTPHTGTGRISELLMYPMTLFETMESNGAVSISRILEDKSYDIDGFMSDLSLESLFHIVCRGGWPRCMALKGETAKLEIAKDYFNNDLDLFGHAFENLVLRDLIVYADAHNAHILHYTDDTGLEADAVYQMADGKYALIEIKVGAGKIPEAEKSLLRFKEVIINHNLEALKNPEHPRAVYREPSALIIICANAPMAYTTDNGVKVIPVGCLKD